MKIISNYKDFYDKVEAYGIDDTIIYRRETKIYSSKSDQSKLLKKYRVKLLDHKNICFGALGHYNGPSFIPWALLFCGHAFLVYEFIDNYTGRHTIENTNFPLLSSIEQVDQKVFSVFKPQRVPGFKTIISHAQSESLISKYMNNQDLIMGHSSFEKSFELVKNMSYDPSIHHELNSPVILTSSHGVFIDPCLENIEFFRVMDAFTCHQMIQSFLGGFMAEQDMMPLTTGGDAVLIQQKGFDPVYSFRTMPPGQKKINRKQNKARKRNSENMATP